MVGMNHSRTQPLMGCPPLVAMGAWSPISVVRDVELPADRHQRVALEQQGGVAEVGFRGRVVGAAPRR